MPLNPVSAFLKANLDLLTGRLRFSRQRLGEKVTTSNGRSYIVFRQAFLAGAQPARTVFEVWFHPKGMSARVNEWFSLLPTPFCVGCPGFVSKLWMVDKATGECAGLYEWETVQDAENYAGSFAMRFSKGRSYPGKFASRVSPR